MGSFNDLPKDVIWLIFKHIILDFLAQNYTANVDFDRGFLFLPQNSLYTGFLAGQMLTLSLISLPALQTIRSKVRAFDDMSWKFKPHVFSESDSTIVYDL